MQDWRCYRWSRLKALSGEIKADAQVSLSNIVGSTLNNTLLTDYISAANGDSDVL